MNNIFLAITVAAGSQAAFVAVGSAQETATPAADATAPAAAPESAVAAPDAAPPEEEAVPAGRQHRATGGKVSEKELFEEEEEVVVGSHIRRKDLTTPSPVIIITHEQIEQSGIPTIGDFLQTMAQQANGVNTTTNNGGDGSTRIDLRGLGANRTLVLLNGRRMIGIDTTGEPDINVIPTAVVDRIEILLDGASGIYGSDAIAGVVNIITKKNYQGSDLQLYTGESGHGDGAIFDLRGTIGVTSDKGSVMLSLDYFNQQGVLAGNRDYTKNALGYNFTTGQVSKLGSTATPAGTFELINPASGGCYAGGTALYQKLCSTPSASGLYKVDPSASLGFSPYNSVLDTYNYQPDNYTQTPSQRISAFSSGDYHLTDNMRAYYEALFTNRQSQQQLAPDPYFTLNNGNTVSANSIYNPFGEPLFDVRRRLIENGDRIFSQDLDTYRVVAGIDGTIPELHSWFYDFSANFGRTEGVNQTQGQLNTGNLQAGIGPSSIVNGAPSCGAAGGPGVAGCVPLNLLGGPGTINQGMLKGLGYIGEDRQYQQMFELQANTSGELFKLWASSPVGLAFGYDFRREYGSYTPDPIQAAGLSDGNNALPTQGGYYVNEGYGELSVPIIDKVPGAYALEAIAALRYSNYSTFGDTTNYKLGGRWSPIQDVALRGTWSTGFRAPGIQDLYLGESQSQPTASDPCATLNSSSPGALAAECAREGVGPTGSHDSRTQLNDVQGGNPNLQPERSDQFNLGVVIEPRWVKNLSFTADYYNLRLFNSITSLGLSEIFSGCYGGTAPGSCANIHRQNGLITNVLDLNTNVGGTSTDGFDFAIQYRIPAQEAGVFSLGFNATYLLNYNQQQASGSIISGVGTYDLGVFPDWKFVTAVNWTGVSALRGFGAGFNVRFFDQYKECSDSTGIASASGACYQQQANAQTLGVPAQNLQRTVPAYAITNAYVDYALTTKYGKSSLQLGINNLFDTPPPLIYDAFQPQSDANTYDFMGRYFYLMATQSF